MAAPPVDQTGETVRTTAPEERAMFPHEESRPIFDQPGTAAPAATTDGDDMFVPVHPCPEAYRDAAARIRASLTRLSLGIETLESELRELD